MESERIAASHELILGSLRLRFDRVGAGSDLVFQHGLGASRRQALQLLPGIDLVAMDAPSHGESDDAPRHDFDLMADAVLALIDDLGFDQGVFGGISMGAGISLNIALRAPERVRGLVLVRPAWLDAPHPPNLGIIARVGGWIDRHGVEAARERLGRDREYIEMSRSNPASAVSIAGAIDAPGAGARGRALMDMVACAPVPSMNDLARITVPTVVLATDADPLHPVEMAATIAAAIPSASFEMTPPRYLEPERHAEVVRTHVQSLLDSVSS